MAVAEVIEDLVKKSKKIKTSEEVAQVGTISANGESQIGIDIAEAMQKLLKQSLKLLKACSSTVVTFHHTS